MMSLVEPSVQFLSSLEPRFRDFGSTQDVSTVGLLQVETFLCMFSTLLDDYFAHGSQKKLKSLEGSCVAKSAMSSAADDCSKSFKQANCSVESAEHVTSKSYASDDCNTLKCLFALAYIWGFGSSLSNR